VLTTIAIIWVLFSESAPFLRDIPLISFLFGPRWSPLIAPASFGALPLICGTFVVAVGAMVVAVPLGLGTAIFMSEYAPNWARSILKPILEVLAGIPTVVYGYFALTFITPNIIQQIWPSTPIYNALSASIVVGIMTLPTICSLCDDALRAVPRSLREAAYAVSATKLEVSLRIVLPAATSGVIAAILLAFARAIGETMAVNLAAGKEPNLTINPLESVQTMTSYMADIAMGDTQQSGRAYQTIFAVGMLLFLITLAINMLARWITGRLREVYE
jgi:phosphate transport system permease protein